MTLLRAEGARIANARSGRMVSVATLALLAPLMLSACVSDGDKLTGTAAVEPTRADDPATAGHPQVIEIASNDTGPTRIALPIAKPEQTTTAVAQASEPAEKGSRVAEAKTEGKGVVAKAASAVTATKNTVVASAARAGSGAASAAQATVATIRNAAAAVGSSITGDPKIDRMIAAAADENDIPRELAYAVVRVESHYNPRARGSGVYGLSQIKPATARSLGFSGSNEALLDPETNLRYGMRYLKGAWEQGGEDVCQAAMKYKGGHRTTVMSKSASVYCSNVKRHIATLRAEHPAMLSPDATLVAAVEPTVRKGIVARTVATKTIAAKAETATVVAAAPAAKTVPAVVAMAPQAPAATTPSAAAITAVLPQSAPRPAERSVNVAENRTTGAVSDKAEGGRVTRHDPDASRFGGSFDASAPSDDLSFN